MPNVMTLRLPGAWLQALLEGEGPLGLASCPGEGTWATSGTSCKRYGTLQNILILQYQALCSTRAGHMTDVLNLVSLQALQCQKLPFPIQILQWGSTGMQSHALTCWCSHNKLNADSASSCAWNGHKAQHQPCLSVVQVEMGRVEAICKAKLKVDADTVLDPESPQALIALVRKLQSLQVTWHRCKSFLAIACFSISPMT